MISVVLFFQMKEYDFFPKVKYEYQMIKTVTGGLISLVTCILLFVTLVFFIYDGLNYKIKESLSQNDTILCDDTNLWLSFNITVDAPCNFLEVYITDDSGHHRKQSIRALMKQNLDNDYTPNGDFQLFTKKISDTPNCDYCYGHKYQECCYSCLDVIYGHISTNSIPPSVNDIKQCQRDLEFYNNGSKCLLVGSTRTPYAYGQLIFSMNSHTQVPKKTLIDNTIVTKYLNMSHMIGDFMFGKQSIYINQPLNNHVQIQNDTEYHQYVYHLDLIPTKITDKNEVIQTTQYSVQFSDTILDQLSVKRPGIIFKFNVYPINSNIVIYRTEISMLLLQVCSIIGGGFVLSGLIQSCIILHPSNKKHV